MECLPNPAPAEAAPSQTPSVSLHGCILHFHSRGFHSDHSSGIMNKTQKLKDNTRGFMKTNGEGPAWPQLGVLPPGEEAEIHFIALHPLGLKNKNKTQQDEILKSSFFCFALFNYVLKGIQTG